jgi:hypothetical protein
VDVHLPDGFKEVRVRQRATVDGLEPALGHDVKHGLLGRLVVGRHEHLYRGAALPGLGGQQLREDRVVGLHDFGLRRELLDLLGRRGRMLDEQASGSVSPSISPGGNLRGRPKIDAEVRDLARVHTADAINTLATIMRDEKEPASARVTAASLILDRGIERPRR